MLFISQVSDGCVSRCPNCRWVPDAVSQLSPAGRGIESCAIRNVCQLWRGRGQFGFGSNDIMPYITLSVLIVFSMRKLLCNVSQVGPFSTSNIQPRTFVDCLLITHSFSGPYTVGCARNVTKIQPPSLARITLPLMHLICRRCGKLYITRRKIEYMLKLN